MFGKKEERQGDEVEFCEKLGKVLSLVANGDCPETVSRTLLLNNQISAVGDDNRPIVNVGMFRKLTASALTNSKRRNQCVVRAHPVWSTARRN